MTEEKIVKIVDTTTHSRGTSVEQVGDQGALITKVVAMPEITVSATVAGDPIPISGATEAMPVAIVDLAGDQINSFGGGTQYDDGETIVGTAIGTLAMHKKGDGTVVGTGAGEPLPVDVTSISGDVATETTLAGIATSVDNLDNKDFATEATLLNGNHHVVIVDGSNTPLQSTGGVLDVNASLGGVGTDITNIESQQTDGSAKTQVVDSLNVNIDFATSSKQDAILTAIEHVSKGFNTNDIEEASATVTYIGMETSEGEWYLKKIDTTSGVSFGHATVVNNGSVASYTDAWTGRASLTYNDYSSAF